MSKNKGGNAAIYDAPVQEQTEYLGTSRIDPRLIHGFPDLSAGDPPVIEDHDDFPNPRTSAMDDELIEDIRANGDFLEPIKLYAYEDDDLGEIMILVEGKTRLTAVAREWAENPDTDKFAQVPYILEQGDPDEIRVRMGLFNLDETRRPLSKLEMAAHLNLMRNRFNMSPEKIQETLGMSQRHVTRFLNDMEKVLANPEVAQLVQKGDLTVTSATDVVNKVKGKDQQAKTAKTIAAAGKKAAADAQKAGKSSKEVKKAQASGEKVARQQTGVKGKSRTTATFPDTIAEYGPRWLALKAAHPESPAYLSLDSLNLADESDLLALLQQTENGQGFRDFKFFLKQNGSSDAEFVTYVESVLPELGVDVAVQVDTFPTALGGKAMGERVVGWAPVDESSAEESEEEQPPQTKAPAAKAKAPAPAGKTGSDESKNGSVKKAVASKPAAKKVTPKK